MEVGIGLRDHLGDEPGVRAEIRLDELRARRVVAEEDHAREGIEQAAILSPLLFPLPLGRAFPRLFSPRPILFSLPAGAHLADGVHPVGVDFMRIASSSSRIAREELEAASAANAWAA